MKAWYRVSGSLGVLAIWAVALLWLTPQAAAEDEDCYAAIAYSPSTGNYGFSYGRTDLEEAQKQAMDICNAQDARVVIWARNRWCALALENKKEARGARGWASGDTAAEARRLAMAECTRRGSRGCHVAICIFTNHDTVPEPPYWCRQKDGPATFKVYLPTYDTTVRIEGCASRDTGQERTYQTPQLTAGKKYTYRLTATIPGELPGGQTVRHSLDLTLHTAAQLVSTVRLKDELLKQWKKEFKESLEAAPEVEPLPLFKP